jgi:ABC-type Zn uptake system ZnuABC Zn-binding protein ZnuA
MRWIPGGPPPEWAQLDAGITKLRTQITNLRQQLIGAPPQGRAQIGKQILALESQLDDLDQQKRTLGCP